MRAYVVAGEPVSSRAVALSHPEGLSPATVRNIMGDLEDAGFLYQPHTSAGRVPTASAYRHFAQQAATQGKLSEEDRKWIRSELDAAATPEEMSERAGHVLAEVSRGLGIIVMPALAQSALEHIRFLHLPDGRVVVVLISTGGATRDKLVRPEHEFTQAQLDNTADYLNTPLRRLDARGDSHRPAAKAGFRARALCASAAAGPGVVRPGDSRERGRSAGVHRGCGADGCGPGTGDRRRRAVARVAGGHLEKSKLVALLDGCIETPEPVHIQIGVKEITSAGEHLALITARYAGRDQGQRLARSARSNAHAV